MKGNRRLAAVMFTDIIGYSKLIALDEDQTVDFLVDSKNSQKQIINKFRGMVWKDLGDGIMASFNTIRDSVKCAEQIVAKSRKENRLNLRIGIHLCDITEREGDIYGEGVNIASRIMGKAGTNEIYISEAAYLRGIDPRDVGLRDVDLRDVGPRKGSQRRPFSRAGVASAS